MLLLKNDSNITTLTELPMLRDLFPTLCVCVCVDTYTPISLIVQLCSAHCALLSLTWLALVASGGNMLLYPSVAINPLHLKG